MPTAHNGQMTEREETDFRVLRALSLEPDLSQRQIARQAGISLGAVNYCLKALAEKGLVKVHNFSASNNKMRYAYVVTPMGMSEKVRLTKRFIARKLDEYAILQAEIDRALSELVDE
jgi:EPS-associated MarR family transcriptional regulator